MSNYEITKGQPQGVAYFFLDILPISAWRWLWKCCFKKGVQYKNKQNNTKSLIFESNYERTDGVLS